MNLDQEIQIALQHHQAGRLGDAEAIYRSVLSIDPNHPGALQYLGVVASQVGQYQAAVELIERSVRAKPTSASAFSNLGSALMMVGRLEDSIAACQRAIELNPNLPDAYNNLGNALAKVGRPEQAIGACEKAIALNPKYFQAFNNLGNALVAVARSEKALAAFARAAEINPNIAETYNNWANALFRAGRSPEAIAMCEQAIALDSNYAEAYNNLGNALLETQQTEKALAALERATQLAPDNPQISNNFGNALLNSRRIGEAIGVFEKILGQKPGFADAWHNLGKANLDIGEVGNAIDSFRRATQCDPGSAEIHSSLVLSMNYDPDQTAQSIWEEHRNWGIRHGTIAGVNNQKYANDKTCDRRLRIGYVSADLRRHSVCYFVMRLLEEHDRSQFDVYCYSNARRTDATSETVKKHCIWRNIVGLSDDVVAEQIRADKIDILIDLSGHTLGNRLGIFARKPAPVLVTYQGYPNTTGMTAVDYRITDFLADPVGMTDAFNAETLWRLPGCNWCYAPPADAPEPVPRGCRPITFGCFNVHTKVNEQLIRRWIELLKNLPGSRLMLKSQGAGEKLVQDRLRNRFAEEGIHPDRLDLRGQTAELRDHLLLYNEVDIALDTHPYHGTTTTCEAMWMGVPVVTLAGDMHACRVGLSLLSYVGAPELIAYSWAEYQTIAIQLAQNPARLDQLRANLRGMMKRSQLLDGKQFTRNMESAYRQMWMHWCG